jgi:hypothetical protein
MCRDARTASRLLGLAAGALLSGALASRPAMAQAEPAGPRAAEAAPSPEALRAERARLQAELDKANAEIDGYKRAGRVGDDYRLRARLADAESLARRLMEIDARLGLRAGAPTAAKPLAPPVASPTDGPADLDAKADILADQVRRLRAQADSFGARARQVKARQELRRRAGDLERDPFGPMEASRRRVASTAGTPTQLQVPGAASLVGGNAPPAGDKTPGGTLGPAISTPGASASGGTLFGPLSEPAPMTQEAAPSVQLHDLLDTATLTDLRRLEGRSAGTSSQALERAAAALRVRAAELDARARAMRAQAHPHP